jgi:hypothetical protein
MSVVLDPAPAAVEVIESTVLRYLLVRFVTCSNGDACLGMSVALEPAPGTVDVVQSTFATIVELTLSFVSKIYYVRIG